MGLKELQAPGYWRGGQLRPAKRVGLGAVFDP